MSLALDIIILALLAAFLIGGMKRGAVKTLINVLGTIAAVTVSIWLGQHAARWIYTTFFQQDLIHSMSQQIMASGGSDVQSGVHSALGALPDFVLRLLPNFGIDTAQIGPAVQNTADATAKAVETVIAPVIVSLLSIVVMLVLFAFMMLLVKLASHAIGAVFNLPVLHGVNSFFGAVLGLLEGVLFVVLVVFLIKLFVPTLSDAPQFFNREVIEGTFIFKYIYSFIPLSGIFAG